MPKSAKNSSMSLRKVIFFACVFALIASFSIFVLEKSGITNLYSKPQSSINISEPKEVNKVDYSNPSDASVNEGNSIKEEAAKQGSESPPSVSSINITLSAAGQDEIGGPIIVRTIINGTSRGECKLTISGSSVDKSFTSSVQNTGTYTSCKGFDVPITDIPAGQYTATVTVTDGSKSGTVSQKFEVRK